MNLPKFLIIGAQKSGTTWLLYNLSQHPDIFMPEKELHFYSNDDNYRKGQDWYTHFFDSGNGKLLGEKTPEYLIVNDEVNKNVSKLTHHRIKDSNPQVKLICILRNPVTRAISAVHHMYRTGVISPFTKIEDVIFEEKHFLGENFSVLKAGLYGQQIEQYLEIFSREKIKIYFYESDVKENPGKTLKDVCSYLAIDNTFSFKQKTKKKNAFVTSYPVLLLNYYLPKLRKLNSYLNYLFPPAKFTVRNSLRERLFEFYQEDMIRLKSITGDLPSSWEKK